MSHDVPCLMLVAQSLKRDLSTEALKSILMKLETPTKDSPPDQVHTAYVTWCQIN